MSQRMNPGCFAMMHFSMLFYSVVFMSCSMTTDHFNEACDMYTSVVTLHGDTWGNVHEHRMQCDLGKLRHRLNSML